MKPWIVRVIFEKELLDMLRDKRTLIAMLAVPLLLYPALFVAGSQVAILHRQQLRGTDSQVAVVPESDPVLCKWVKAVPGVEIVDVPTPLSALREGRIDAVVAAENQAPVALQSEKTVKVFIHYDTTEGASRLAADRIEKSLLREKMEIVHKRLQAVGLTAEYVTPLDISRNNVAPPTKATGTLLGMILPLVMVVMVGVGAFYPAIDLTAGEKERGTFETLLAAPVSTVEIVCGKFLTVFLLSMLTGLLNLGSMSLTFAFEVWQLGDRFGMYELYFPPLTLVLLVVALIPLSLFISAMMMSIAMFARSFREGQNLVSPFLLLILFPAAYVAVPGSSLTAATQLIPISNVALLFKEMMTGPVPPDAVFAVLASTGSYAILALILAARLFQREEVILSEDLGIPLTLRRSSITPRPTPTTGTALGIFAICMLLVFYVGQYWQGRSLIPGLLMTEWLLFLLPSVGMLWYFRINLVTGLGLGPASWRAYAVTLMLAAAWLILAIEGSFLQNKLLPLPEELSEPIKAMFNVEQTGVGFWGLLLVLAISPAVCEETLFRGVLLRGLNKRVPLALTLPAVGFLFAMAHFSVHKAPLMVLTGTLLAYVAWRTDSLYPAVLLHFINNAMQVVIGTGRLPKGLMDYFESEAFEDRGLPLYVVASAVVILALGIVLMQTWVERPRRRM